jgi:hypothetical protein
MLICREKVGGSQRTPLLTKEREVLMERTEIKVGKITITITDKDSLMVELNGYTYFIDDSTDENLMKRYKDK